MEIIDDYSDRLLGDEKGLFSYEGSYKYLWGIGIITIGDLLNNKERVFGRLLADRRLISDIKIAIKLLECKYLDIDPGIRIKEDCTIVDFVDELGLNSSIFYALVKAGEKASPKMIMNIINENNEEDARAKLLCLRNLGENRVNEIYYKASIVLNYDKNKGKDKNPSQNEELLTEYFKLLEKSKEVKALDAEIDSKLDRLLDKMAKEGILTEENISKHK